jgi:hypothetical protein
MVSLYNLSRASFSLKLKISAFSSIAMFVSTVISRGMGAGTHTTSFWKCGCCSVIQLQKAVQPIDLHVTHRKRRHLIKDGVTVTSASKEIPLPDIKLISVRYYYHAVGAKLELPD